MTKGVECNVEVKTVFDGRRTGREAFIRLILEQAGIPVDGFERLCYTENGKLASVCADTKENHHEYC